MEAGQDQTQVTFSSRLAMIVSVLGIAVGTGNIWRFPRIAALNGDQEGSGAFLLSWVLFLFLWSIPLIIAEYAIGRAGRKSPTGSFAKLGGQSFTWMGGFVSWVALAIMFYYSVIAGWCLFYFGSSLFAQLPTDSQAAQLYWDSFQSGYWPLTLHALMMGAGAFIVSRGIRIIERVNLVLIPILLVIVLISFVRAITLDNAGEGIGYLFAFNSNTLLKPEVWLEALTQNAWDTGAGWGLILCYGAYARRGEAVVKSAFITGIGNNLVSVISAITIFATIFGLLSTQMPREHILEIMKTSGPASTGLTFIWMPQLFQQLPGGNFFGTLFFLGLSFAAFSSLISMIELGVRNVVDLGAERNRASLWVGLVGFTLGIPSAINIEFLSNQDFVWGLALMISGLFISMLVIKNGARRFADEFVNQSSDDMKVGRFWVTIMQIVIPVQVLVLLGWWIWRSATEFAADAWYDPFNAYSVATCVVQWGLAGLFLKMFSNRLYEKIN